MKITSLGIMSGTSLDGVDLALCQFSEINNKWQYEILESNTIRYSTEWKQKLKTAHKLDALDFLLLHNEYGRYIGTFTTLCPWFRRESTNLLSRKQFPQ